MGDAAIPSANSSARSRITGAAAGGPAGGGQGGGGGINVGAFYSGPMRSTQPVPSPQGAIPWEGAGGTQPQPQQDPAAAGAVAQTGNASLPWSGGATAAAGGKIKGAGTNWSPGEKGGVQTIRGKQMIRDGGWWVDKALVDRYAARGIDILGMDPAQNPQLAGEVEANRIPYQQGVTQMAIENRGGAAGGGPRPTTLDWSGAIPMAGGTQPGPAPGPAQPATDRTRSALQPAAQGPTTRPRPADPNARPQVSTDRPGSTDRPAPGAPGAPAAQGSWIEEAKRLGFTGNPNSAQALLATKGFVVGESAAAAHPNMKKFTWNDAAQAIGWTDFKGAKRDPRFRALQDIVYGHSGDEAAKAKLIQALLAHPAVGGGGGTGGAPPPLLEDGAMVHPQPGGHHMQVNEEPVVIGEGDETELVIPYSKLQKVVGDGAARAVAKAVSHTVVGGDRLATGGTTYPRPRDRFDGALPSPIDDQGNTYMTQPGGPAGTGVPGSRPAQPGYSPLYSGGQYTGAAATLPYGEGGSYQPFSGYTPATYSPYQKQDMTPQEKAELQAITDIARQLGGRGEGLYNIGSGAYADAVKYFQTLTKGNRGAITAAVAPSAELIREQAQGARDSASAGMGRGGGRDLALAKIGQQSQGDIARLTAGVQPAAAQTLGSLGGQGIAQAQDATTAAAGAHGNVREAYTQHRQFEEGMGEQSRQFGAGLEEGSRQFGTQLTEQSRQFGASLAEQVRQGNMSWEQANRTMALQERMFSEEFKFKVQSFQESIRQFNESLGFSREQLKAQTKAQNRSFWGQLFGSALGVIPFLGEGGVIPPRAEARG